MTNGSRSASGAPAGGVEPASEAPGFAERRAFLESGAAWPDEPLPLCLETHASIVLVGRSRVLKLKKPVRMPQMDLRTLAGRARYCAEELRLNRALAGEVYRGLLPLVRRADGRLALGGPGQIEDWLVEMERLPAEQMLDRRIAGGPPPDEASLQAFADRMIAFYRAQPRPPQAGETYHARLAREMRVDIAHLRELRRLLGGELKDDLLDAAAAALAAARPGILARAEAGLVIEGHGDLRAEHVCLTRPPVAFDRVEFGREFRLVDPYDEMNALGLDCARLGADWIGPLLLRRLADAGLAAPGAPLLRVYGAARCLTLARLALDHLRDAVVRTPAKWAPRARYWLGAAAAALREGG